MKQDFILARKELQNIGIIQVCKNFYIEPRRKGNCYFVKSPVTPDKTASLALFPNSNRFTDFSNGNYSGDIISFIAYIRGCNNWQALKELQSFYGLTNSWEQNREEAQRKIQLQREQERKKAERKQTFYRALYDEIDRLKRWENICKTSIKKAVFEPDNELFAFCVKELESVQHKLDILCASDCTYVRMKPNTALGLPSDRPQWLLDCLAILQDCDAFQATKTEIEEITAQKNFELTRKSNETDRRCKIEW